MQKFNAPNFESYFKERTLRKGWQYFRNNHIHEIYYLDNTHIQAIVNESTLYDVDIILEEELKMKCSCPENENCKHMAAVIFYINKHSIPKGEKRLEQPELELRIFEKQFINSIYHETNGSFCFDDGQEDTFNELIDLNLNEIKKHKGSNLAFLKLFCLLDVIKTVEFEDNNDPIYDASKKVWDYFLSICFIDFNLSLSCLLNFFQEGSNNHEISSTIEMIMPLITLKEDALIFIHFIGALKRRFSHDFENHKRELLTNYEYDLSFKFGLDSDILSKIKVESFTNSLMRKKYLDILEEKYEDDQIIEYLEERLLLPNNSCKRSDLRLLATLNQFHGYYGKAIHFYQRLFKLDAEYSDYEAIKALSLNIGPEEINTLLECSKNIDKQTYEKICINEELFDKLFAFSIEMGIDYLYKNCKYFIERFLTDFTIEYKKAFLNFVVKIKSKRLYQYAILYLKEMINFKDGIDEIHSIIKEVKTSYPNRKLLIEELDYFEDRYLN